MPKQRAPKANTRAARPAHCRREGETRPVRRSCLSCGNSFASEGPHNRVCAGCKTGKVWKSGDARDYSSGFASIPKKGENKYA
ncbi:MAG: hypothetical protein Q8K65_12140 [Alphaproteobacteria bacterium]|nr:hypothetical protein [Alphaproteobacteria bacterium]